MQSNRFQAADSKAECLVEPTSGLRYTVMTFYHPVDRMPHPPGQGDATAFSGLVAVQAGVGVPT